MNNLRKPFILGMTPARGGSKGVPRKNIRMIAGKPLIAWTIEAAGKSRFLDKYVVSTEDSEIAKIASRYGVEVLKRPKGLATDKATTLSVLKHAVEHIPCDIVVLLQATSAVRKSGLIDSCIEEFIDKGYDSLATGFICKYVEYAKDIHMSHKGQELQRQQIKGFFYDDGNIYIVKSEVIRKNDRYGKKIGRRIISRWENHEIDDEFDFWIAEKILREKKYK